MTTVKVNNALLVVQSASNHFLDVEDCYPIYNPDYLSACLFCNNFHCSRCLLWGEAGCPINYLSTGVMNGQP